MKVLMIILPLIFFCSFNFQKKLPLRTFTLGKFSYDMYEESKYSHDDNWNAVYLIVVKHGKHQELCSAYMEAKRGDSTFIKGTYSIYEDKIEFDRYYYYDKSPVSIDSMKILFYPNKKGDLSSKKIIEFKDGKATITTRN